MEVHYPSLEEAATPAYVLAVLSDLHRQEFRYDPETKRGIALSFDSTVDELAVLFDVTGWQEVGRLLNCILEIDISDADWQPVLEPMDSQPLSGVCELVACRVRRPVVRRARIFGGNCLSAGAFLTIRSLLHASGAPAAEIAPSTLLAHYLRRHCTVFLGPIARLAPGALPLLRFRRPLSMFALLSSAAGVVLVVIGMRIGREELVMQGFLLCVIGAIKMIAMSLASPESVEFGPLQTFRDLARVVAVCQERDA